MSDSSKEMCSSLTSDSIDCIYQRLRSGVTRLTSSAQSKSHLFFVFGASVCLHFELRREKRKREEKENCVHLPLGRFSKEKDLSNTLVCLTKKSDNESKSPLNLLGVFIEMDFFLKIFVLLVMQEVN